jgi:putative ABC transport system permease protein
VINGTLRQVRVVGIAMCPEYVFPLPVGGLFSDERRFAVLWMDRAAVSAAFEMDGAFNDVALSLQPGASIDAVKEQLDQLLAQYGGIGAVGRDKQPSNYILEGEMSQLEIWATMAPAIFLGVAAFLLNVVLSRLILLQRSQIATLKAVGYSNRAVGFHYLKLVCAIVLVGAVVGTALGAYLGRELTDLYTQFFRFPDLTYRLDVRVAFIGIGVSLGAALVGAFVAVRRVVSLPPAEAMRPPPPIRYRRSLLERLGLRHILGPASRMVLRELTRRPLRLTLSSIGIAMAVAITVVSRFSADAIDQLIEMQFHQAWREDVMVTFLRPTPERAIRDLEQEPGVLHAEPLRAIPVRMRNGPRFRDSTLLGYPPDITLRRILDREGRTQPIPPDGVMITDKLAEVLGLHVGDDIEVEVREGDRRTERLRIAALADEPFGLSGHMQLPALWRFAREDRVISMALLSIDPAHYAELEERLKEMPGVGAVLRMETIIDQFEEQSADMLLWMTFILTLFAATIAVGVVYNNARIALSMRSRDLASLRVLGFTRAEISAVLLGELAIQVLVAIPVGLVIGTWLCEAMANSQDPEQYRLPIVLSSQTYAFATLVTLGAGLFSALLVRRQLDKLDLIGVLKTRE